MNPNFTEYTFTFDREGEPAFRETLSRLEPEEYNIISDIEVIDPENSRSSKRKAIIEMEPESASTFRFRLGNSINIRRKRTEEEEAEEKALLDRHKVKVTVKVDPSLLPPQNNSTSTP